MENLSLNNVIKSVYPYNEMSLQQLLSRFYKDIQSMNNYIEWLKDKGIAEEVANEIGVMYENGDLERLVNIDKYNTLDNKFTNDINVINEQLTDIIYHQEQEDYVESLLNQVHVSKMNLHCVRPETMQYRIVYETGGDKAMSYELFPQSNDNYAILQGGRIGTLLKSYATNGYATYKSKSGTFVESGVNHYTTTPGNKLFYEITNAETVMFNYYAEPRGGLWKFVLNDDIDNPVYVSCYRDTPNSLNSETIFENLNKNRTYSIVAEFMGDDPDNPPSSSPSRGYYKVTNDNNTNNYDSMKLVRVMLNVTDSVMPLKDGSNKEFAFNLRRSGQTYDYTFFPWHSVVSTQKVKDLEVWVDGVLFNSQLTSAVTYKDVNKVEIIQYINCKLPSDENTLGYMISKHTFKKDGSVNVNCTFKAYEDLDIKTGYVAMLPVSNSTCKKLKTSYLNTYETIKTDGSKTSLIEKDNAVSFIWGEGETEDIAVAMTIINPYSSYRKGKNGRGNPITWIQHRNSTMQKLYPHVFENATLNSGEVYSFTFKIGMGKSNGIDGLYFM